MSRWNWRSQALQRSVRPGVNPGNARIQGLHRHANTLADGRNDERNSGRQQAQADRNDARSNPESEHQDDKKRRERQHTPIPRSDMLAPNWGGNMENLQMKPALTREESSTNEAS